MLVKCRDFVAIYAYFQAQNMGSQAPKTFLHPCDEDQQQMGFKLVAFLNSLGHSEDIPP